MRTAVFAGLMLATAASTVEASAWTQKRGKAQVIAKAEAMRATLGYGPSGAAVPLPAPREDIAAGVLAEFGLTDRVTLQLKGDWQTGEDAFVDYSGRGPIEVGLTWQAWRDDHAAVSLYAGYATGGDGRNAGYAAPGIGEHDWEVRVAVGRGFGAPAAVAGRWGADRMFVEVQAARRMRQGLPDEVRADLTAGAHFGEDWMVLAQAFGGVTDGGGARWLSAETSVVRHLGGWSLQAGWRRTVAGRETPLAEGPVIALWKRF